MLATLGKDAILLRFQHQVQLLSQQKIISCYVGDKSLLEFEQLIIKPDNAIVFSNFDSCTERLDSFFLTI